jgi:hypothetical protein
MNKYPLIGFSILAVVLLVLGSLSNVVGYQSIQSSGVNDSPLFSVRTQRATNQQQNIIMSQYLGKGQYSISFPVRDNRTLLIRKVVDKIREMDNESFDRLIYNIISQINHIRTFKDIDSREVIKELRLLRETKSIQNIIIDKDANNLMSNYTYLYIFFPTICWFPGCVIVTVSLCVIYAILDIIVLIFLYVSTIGTCSAICLGPPTKQCLINDKVWG